jgi:hypothetical protein
MKFARLFLTTVWLTTVGSVGLWLCDEVALAAGPPSTNWVVEIKTDTKAVVIPVSVFETNEASRDPFFPNTTRLKKREVAPTNAPVEPMVPLELALRGIAGTANRRIALINNRQIQVGEEVEFKAPNGKPVRVRCVEIKSESVVVMVGNSPERKELNLRR